MPSTAADGGRLAALSVDAFLGGGFASAAAPVLAAPPAPASDCGNGFALFAPSKRLKRDPAAAAAAAEAAAAPPPPGGAAAPPAAAPVPEPLVALDGDAPFKSLGLAPWLVGNCAALGLRRPTPVQHACVPAVLAGRDCIGIAETGSGKTAAFALPVLQRLAVNPYGVYCLVLTPTRELAVQIGEQFVALAAGFPLRCCVAVGGEDKTRQAGDIARRPHVLVATPGRLRDHLQGSGETAAALCRAAVVVLDEADRLLEPSFETELAVILRAVPPSRQTLLLSATLTPAVAALQRLTGAQAFRFGEGAGPPRLPPGLAHRLLLVPAKVKEAYLVYLVDPERLRARGCAQAILFVATVRGAQLLGETLKELGARPAVLHGALAQAQRRAALARFRGGAAQLLVATDVASRGLDVPQVDLVIHVDVPSAADDYVHRCGRTARAGRKGTALSLVTQYDAGRVAAIEAATGARLAPLDDAEVDERDVLRGLRAVGDARRAAQLRLAEPGGFDDQLKARRTGRREGGGDGGQPKGGRGERPARE